MKPTKKQLDSMIDVLDADHEDMKAAATAALAEAWRLYEERAGWMVIAQVRYSQEGGYVDKYDQQASLLALGPYETERLAEQAAQGLRWGSHSTGEFCTAYVVPMWHGTPAAWYSSRAKVYKELHKKKAAWSDMEDRLQRRLQFYEIHGHSDFPVDIDDDTVHCPTCGAETDDAYLAPTKWRNPYDERHSMRPGGE